MVTVSGAAVYFRSKLSPNYNIAKATADALRETFIEQQYKWLITSIRPNTMAIDIGAFIGDSAIYLAMNKEIKQIDAYEPFPDLYYRAKQNIRSSGFSEKINLHNVGISDMDAEFRLSNMPQGMTSRAQHGRLGKMVKITTLERVLHGKKNVILKCDCEGEEHKIFRPGTSLPNVYKIQMEYHHGTGSIMDFLKSQGFSAKKQVLNANGITSGEVGFIYAELKA